MGVARLLAKGWVVFCLYAGAHALARALGANVPPIQAAQQIGVCTLLFGAMGLLFIGGYGVSASHVPPLLARLKPQHLWPGFNEIVFAAFAAASFFMQVVYAPSHLTGPTATAIQGAIHFASPGQRVLESALGTCALDGGRVLSSAFAWLLAFVFLGSAISRVRLAAGIVRLERKLRPEALGPTALAVIVFFAAIAGFQMLYIGSFYPLVPCQALAGVPGSVLIGIGPLMLAYLMNAALTDLLALAAEA
jgi:hypothetical protein